MKIKKNWNHHPVYDVLCLISLHVAALVIQNITPRVADKTCDMPVLSSSHCVCLSESSTDPNWTSLGGTTLTIWIVTLSTFFVSRTMSRLYKAGINLDRGVTDPSYYPLMQNDHPSRTMNKSSVKIRISTRSPKICSVHEVTPASTAPVLLTLIGLT